MSNVHNKKIFASYCNFIDTLIKTYPCITLNSNRLRPRNWFYILWKRLRNFKSNSSGPNQFRVNNWKTRIPYTTRYVYLRKDGVRRTTKYYLTVHVQSFSCLELNFIIHHMRVFFGSNFIIFKQFGYSRFSTQGYSPFKVGARERYRIKDCKQLFFHVIESFSKIGHRWFHDDLMVS